MKIFRQPLLWFVWLLPPLLFFTGEMDLEGIILWGAWFAEVVTFTCYFHSHPSSPAAARPPVLLFLQGTAVLVLLLLVYLLTYPVVFSLARPEIRGEPRVQGMPRWVMAYGRPYFWLMDHSFLSKRLLRYQSWHRDLADRWVK